MKTKQKREVRQPPSNCSIIIITVIQQSVEWQFPSTEGGLITWYGDRVCLTETERFLK